MRVLTNLHKICIVKVKASSKPSDNVCTFANTIVADPNILLCKSQQYIMFLRLLQYSHNSMQFPESTDISQR